VETNTASGKWSGKKVFTTGEAAEVCKVSQQTIIRCFDAGRLGGFRVPGSKFRRILIVDDDPGILELFQDVLGKDNRFDVRVASNGYDAGLQTEAFKPHLVVLDFMLPDINGNLVCQRIRSNPEMAGTKIIIVSGVVNQSDIDKLRGAGADEFVKKPFNVHQLIERMNALMTA
jgi:two-component system, OmpR family, response regulator